MKVDRTYKDSLFRIVFRKKEDLLSLYNALNGTQYDDPEGITVNTLERIIYIGMKNDISFILDGNLSLYEHQSTKNANMPLRDLFYVTQIFQDMVGEEEVYREKIISLPTPRFVVFYNGKDDMPDDTELRLSDSFAVRDKMPGLELVVRVINVNEGRNPKLMAACRKLEEYSRFVALVRRMKDEKGSLEEAMEAAIEEALRNGILTEILTKGRAQVANWFFSEYNEELHRKVLREEAYEDGISQGRLEEIMDSIAEGYYDLETGARKSGLTVQELEARMRETEQIVPV